MFQKQKQNRQNENSSKEDDTELKTIQKILLLQSSYVTLFKELDLTLIEAIKEQSETPKEKEIGNEFERLFSFIMNPLQSSIPPFLLKNSK